MVTSDRTESEALSTSSAEYSQWDSNVVALHRATLSLFSDLSLDGVLRRVIQAAQELVDARYAALGIPDGQGGLETFITLGLSEEVIRALDDHPKGDGLIGEMLRTGTSIRVEQIGAHPKSAGFPEGHPNMGSFLGVPIAAYGRPIGQIYLTDKRSAPNFSIEDQRLIEMLAAHAAAAIENARLFQKVLDRENELGERNEELGLMFSLATAVSSSMELDLLLEVMLGRVMSLFHAAAGEIFLLHEGEGIYQKAIHLGDSPDAFWEIDRFRMGQGFIGQVAQSGSPRWTTKLRDEVDFLRRSVVDEGFQTLVCAPLTAPGKVTGVLSLAFKTIRPIEDREIGLLGAVGAGVGVAVENGRLYRQAHRVAVLEERERIGMDLHDGIIQSIYAIGLTLDYTRLMVSDALPEAAERLEQTIGGLNSVIRDLRSYILDLQPAWIKSDNLKGALSRLIREFRANTLVDADLKLEDQAEAYFSDQRANDLFLITQEALANTAKHAKATRVLVSLRFTAEDSVTLQVIDNGKGFEAEVQTELIGHGLSNMGERASSLGGQLDIVSSPGEGTTVTVRIPVPLP
ncbi:MAG: GAF domain-containing protein [Anaerolineales bacterium]|nr:MAG: GAF domain-containing protein [Anaerolineales bacterium]